MVKSVRIVVAEDAPNGAFVVQGSRTTGGTPLFGFGPGGMCRDYRRSTLEDLRDPGIHELSRVPIFARLADMWRSGHDDEATFVCACLAIPPPPGEDDVVVAVWDAAEMGVAKIICRFLLLPPDDGPGPAEERDLHLTLGAHAPGSPADPVTAAMEVPTLARTYVADDSQRRSAPPPLGWVPNVRKTCYVAAPLVVFLSIPAVRDAVREAPVQQTIEGTMFVDLMKMFAWHLFTGGYNDEIDTVENMSLALLDLGPFESFRHGGPDDARRFSEALLGAFGAWIPGARGLFGGGGVYGIPSLRCVGERPQPPVVPVPVPGVLREETLSDGTWRCDFVPGPSSSPRPWGRSPVPVYERAASGPGRTGTIAEYLADALGPDRPVVAALSHKIRSSDEAHHLPLPCTAALPDGSVYSLHGAVMYDNNATSGHYTAAICSNTSLYVYDPQRVPDPEDPRTYRPRLLVFQLLC